MHHAFGEHEARAERVARPVHHRVPVPALQRDQAIGLRRAIEQHVGAEIVLDLGGDRRGRRRHAVDDRVGEPRERHGRRIDHLLLRAPFGGDRLRERLRPARPAACARACAPRGRRAAPGSRPRCVLAGRGLLVEPRAQLRAHVAPRRLHRIERLVGENVLENVAHRSRSRPYFSAGVVSGIVRRSKSIRRCNAR